jgi:very-short-patch-repair endonuclease
VLDPAPLATIARRQAGAVARHQAHALGWSNDALARAVARGLLVRRFPDVFVLAGSAGPRTDDWAAVLGGGPGTVLAGWSAARYHAMHWDHVPTPPTVLLPPNRHVPLPGVRVLRHALDAGDTQPGRGGLVVTRPARTVLDCLRLAPPAARDRMLDVALQRRWTSVAAFDAQVTALAGQRDVRHLRQLLAGVTDGARSSAERRAQQVIAGCGLDGWRWNHPVEHAGRLVAVVDAALPHLRLAIEIDGRAFHVDVDAFQRDRTRQNELVTLGWTVLRFTWADLRDRPRWVQQTIRDAVLRLAG